MKKIYFLLILFLFAVSICYSKETLYDKAIEFDKQREISLDIFCKNFIQDVDIEKFIKDEIFCDYVVVSLDECIDVALKNNLDIYIAYKDYHSNRYEYYNSLSEFLPILNSTSYVAEYDGQILVGGVLRRSFRETALSVNFTLKHKLTDGGRQIFEAKAKKYFAKSKRDKLNYTNDEIIFQTVTSYYNMLLAKISIEIYFKNLLERNAQLQLANNLEKSGIGTKFDVIRSKKESEEAKLQLIRAINQFRDTQINLASVMGICVETQLLPFESSVKALNLINDEINISDLYDYAVKYRNDLKSMKNIVAYSKEIKKSYITDYFPKPMITAQEQFQGTLSNSVRPNYILSGFLYWEPGKNSLVGTYTKIKSQDEKIKLEKARYDKRLGNIQKEIVISKSKSIYSRKQISLAKNRMNLANESIKLATLRFNNGSGILLDVIEAQSEATKAKIDFITTIIDFNLAQINLLNNCGLITRQKILNNYKP